MADVKIEENPGAVVNLGGEAQQEEQVQANNEDQEQRQEQAKIAKQIEDLKRDNKEKASLLDKIKRFLLGEDKEDIEEDDKQFRAAKSQVKVKTKTKLTPQEKKINELLERQAHMEFEMACRDHNITSNDEKEYFYYQLEKHDGDEEKAVAALRKVFPLKEEQQQVEAREDEAEMAPEEDTEQPKTVSATGENVYLDNRAPQVPHRQVSLEEFNNMSLMDKGALYKADIQQYQRLTNDMLKKQGWIN